MTYLRISGLARRFLQRLPLLVSAALIAAVVHDAGDHPLRCLVLLLGSTCALLPSLLARRRLRKIMLSGDVAKILSIWLPAARAHPDHETAEPLVAATAFVAFGWVTEARAQLALARFKGPCAGATEHRIFVETLIEAFDGDREHALHLANCLAALPLPDADARLREQVQRLRLSLVALARAFARCPQGDDLDTLERASKSSPLVSWAMRYAAAIVALDQGQIDKVHVLLDGAPVWPTQSSFRAFHEEIAERAHALARPS